MRDEDQADVPASRDSPLPDGEQIPAAEADAERTASRFDRRAPFLVGLTASAGVAVTYLFLVLLSRVSAILVLVGLAFFLALGLEPAVAWLMRKRLARPVAVTVVFICAFVVVGGFLVLAIPPLVDQTEQFIRQAPDFLHQLQDRSSLVGRINNQFHIQQRLTDMVNGAAGSVISNLVSAGTAVISAVADFFIVTILTIYFLADLPRIRETLYHFVPRSRRRRAIRIGDEIVAKVGAYVLGNLVTSVIAGVGTYLWLAIFDVPYALLLAIFVALFDLIPIVGSTIAGIGVAAVALTVSLPTGLSTIGFFVAFRMVEDYFLIPRIIGRVVRVPGLMTIVSVLIGGSLLGIIGALVAIPIAAAAQLIVQEFIFPRLEET